MKKGKKTYSKKRPTTKALADRIHKLEKAPEVKFHDSAFGPTAIVAGGITWTSLVLVPQGDDVEQRAGNKITTKYLHLRTDFQGSATALGDSFVRVIVFWDKAPNGFNPVVVDNLANSQALLDSNIGVLSGFYAYRNMRTANRYKIMSDTTHKLEPHAVAGFNVATGATTSVVPPHSFTIKNIRLGRSVVFSGSTNAITDLSLNGLYVAYLQNVTATFANVAGTSRITYTDV